MKQNTSSGLCHLDKQTQQQQKGVKNKQTNITKQTNNPPQQNHTHKQQQQNKTKICPMTSSQQTSKRNPTCPSSHRDLCLPSGCRHEAEVAAGPCSSAALDMFGGWWAPCRRSLSCQMSSCCWAEASFMHKVSDPRAPLPRLPTHVGATRSVHPNQSTEGH